MAYIREIFTSVQGEGPLVGYKQLFVRFCHCNLHCAYCDTDFDITSANNYTSKELIDICNSASDCHSVSLTGGEPLLEADFLKEVLTSVKLPIYLETNGTLVDELSKIINYVSYIAADIKLESCTKQQTDWINQDKFLAIASEKNLFAKVVFDYDITDFEIDNITKLSKRYNIELILQPKMKGSVLSVSPAFITEILNRCLSKYSNVRLIPQVHKFLNVD